MSSPFQTMSSLRVGMTACISFYISQHAAKCCVPWAALVCVVPGLPDRQPRDQPEVYFIIHWSQGHFEYWSVSSGWGLTDAKDAPVCIWITEGQRTKGFGREPQKASAMESMVWPSMQAGRESAPTLEGCTLLFSGLCFPFPCKCYLTKAIILISFPVGSVLALTWLGGLIMLTLTGKTPPSCVPTSAGCGK